jgi:hypothetical protein
LRTQCEEFVVIKCASQFGMRIFLLPVLIRKSEGYREDLTRRKACLTRAEKLVRSLQNRIPMAMEKKLEIRI